MALLLVSAAIAILAGVLGRPLTPADLDPVVAETLSDVPPVDVYENVVFLAGPVFVPQSSAFLLAGLFAVGSVPVLMLGRREDPPKRLGLAGLGVCQAASLIIGITATPPDVVSTGLLFVATSAATSALYGILLLVSTPLVRG